MKAIYNALLDRFTANEALFTTKGLKSIAHIDRFKGQYLNPELHQPWPVPALFFKFTIEWEDKGANTQRGTGMLEVHTELENYHESYKGSIDKDAALADYDYYEVIHAIIQGFAAPGCTPFTRISTEEDENPSNTNVAITRYLFQIDDNSTEQYADWLSVKLDDMITPQKPQPAAPVANDKFTV